MMKDFDQFRQKQKNVICNVDVKNHLLKTKGKLHYKLWYINEGSRYSV